MTANLRSGLDILSDAGCVFAPNPRRTEVVVPCLSKAFVDVVAGDAARDVSLGLDFCVKPRAAGNPSSRLR